MADIRMWLRQQGPPWDFCASLVTRLCPHSPVGSLTWNVCHLEQYLSCFNSRIQVAHSDFWNWESIVQYNTVRARISAQLHFWFSFCFCSFKAVYKYCSGNCVIAWSQSHHVSHGHLPSLSGEEQIFLLFFLFSSLWHALPISALFVSCYRLNLVRCHVSIVSQTPENLLLIVWHESTLVNGITLILKKNQPLSGSSYRKPRRHKNG